MDFLQIFLIFVKRNKIFYVYISEKLIWLGESPPKNQIFPHLLTFRLWYVKINAKKGCDRMQLKKMRTQGLLLTLYSAGHFLVDFTCAFLMITLVASASSARLPCLLLYNFCAFALQMPAGLIADRLDRNAAVAVSGFVLTLIAFACYPVPLLCAVVLGIGNCLYHVGGGVDVLHFSETKQWMLGVYVSPGAVGLFLGGMLARQSLLALPLGFVLILAAMALLTAGLHLTHPLRKPSGNVPPSLKTMGRAPVLAVILLLLVVVLRSYVGMTLSFPWKTGGWSLLMILGVAGGKAAGGFLADRLGAIRASVVSLSLCALLFCFSSTPVCGLLAVFLFNMTMPLTLFAMARLFPSARGFAFGTLTFALFLGYLPTHLSLPIPFAGEGWWYTVEAALSLILLVAGLLACRAQGGDSRK